MNSTTRSSFGFATALGHPQPMPPPRFSVIIPARDEERFIGSCLDSIRVAAEPYPNQVEVIVVLNRCSDRTEEIAHAFGARTIREDARNLARIRNAGARSAVGLVLVTIDADSKMSPGTLVAIDRALSSGTTVGGGTVIHPDRWSPGIMMTLLFFKLWVLICRLSCGLFWCYREDFETIGGFKESLVSGEDIDFARRLRARGKTVGRPFSTLRGAYIVTSCRKFDVFGDWCVIKNPLLLWRLLKGKNQTDADVFYYDFERGTQHVRHQEPCQLNTSTVKKSMPVWVAGRGAAPPQHRGAPRAIT